MESREQWEWYGVAAHLIVGRNCRFHLATIVGEYLISTVGQYVPDSDVREALAQTRGVTLRGWGDERERSWMEQVGYEEIGAGRTYETMVFKVDAADRCAKSGCNCGMPQVSEWSEKDSDGYNDAGAATRGHLLMCEKWAAIQICRRDGHPFDSDAPPGIVADWLDEHGYAERAGALRLAQAAYQV